MTEAAPEEPTDGHENGRSRWPTILIIAATVLAIVSLFSTWVRVQALETDSWVTLADEMLEEPEVQQALSAYLVDEFYAQVDVPAEIGDKLPDGFERLAGPVSSALRAPATTGVERLVASEQFGRLWATTNRTAHEKLVAILRDETRPGVSTADGAVTLELGVLLQLVGADFGLSDEALDRLPPDAGAITVFESDELEAAQQTVQLLDFLSWFLFVLVVGLYAAAVYLAPPDRRRPTLRKVGLSLMIGSVIVLIVRLVAVRTTVDFIVADPGTRPVAEVAGYVATGAIRQMAWSGFLCGLLIAAFAVLLGERSWAKATRRALAPALNSSVWAVTGGTVLLLLLLFWWGPGRVFDSAATAIVFILLVIGAVAALRRSTRQEFPTETMSDVATSVSTTMSSIELPGRAARTETTVASQLGALRELRLSGDLADDEYEQAKQLVLEEG